MWEEEAVTYYVDVQEEIKLYAQTQRHTEIWDAQLYSPSCLICII